MKVETRDGQVGLTIPAGNAEAFHGLEPDEALRLAMDLLVQTGRLEQRSEDVLGEPPLLEEVDPEIGLLTAPDQIVLRVRLAALRPLSLRLNDELAKNLAEAIEKALAMPRSWRSASRNH